MYHPRWHVAFSNAVRWKAVRSDLPLTTLLAFTQQLQAVNEQHANQQQEAEQVGRRRDVTLTLPPEAVEIGLVAEDELEQHRNVPAKGRAEVARGGGAWRLGQSGDSREQPRSSSCVAAVA